MRTINGSQDGCASLGRSEQRISGRDGSCVHAATRCLSRRRCDAGARPFDGSGGGEYRGGAGFTGRNVASPLRRRVLPAAAPCSNAATHTVGAWSLPNCSRIGPAGRLVDMLRGEIAQWLLPTRCPHHPHCGPTLQKERDLVSTAIQKPAQACPDSFDSLHRDAGRGLRVAGHQHAQEALRGSAKKRAWLSAMPFLTKLPLGGFGWMRVRPSRTAAWLSPYRHRTRRATGDTSPRTSR